jgi:hypothetical protein
MRKCRSPSLISRDRGSRARQGVARRSPSCGCESDGDGSPSNRSRSARGREDRPGCCRSVRESAARASGGSPESRRGHSKLRPENRVPLRGQPIRWTTPRLFRAPGLKCSLSQVGVVESSAHRTVPLARISALSRQTSTFQTPPLTGRVCGLFQFAFWPGIAVGALIGVSSYLTDVVQPHRTKTRQKQPFRLVWRVISLDGNSETTRSIGLMVTE